MTQERKVVTVLYADIVGSTALTGQHDPEVVREALDRAFARIERILTAHGATVEKFIGDAVMAVFGIPNAHDDDADRAVRAAFASRDAVAGFAGPGGTALRLRIGINTGEAVAGGGASERVLVTGEPVIAGARLQQAAAPGEILIGALTHQLTEGGVRFDPPRQVDAKGIGTLEAWPAAGLTSVVPEEHRGLAGHRAPLIGRDHEMRFLRDAYARLATEERAYLITVFGPPGSGKSRLTDEFVASLTGARVRRGRCLPYGEAITFYPLQLILRADAGIEPSDTRDQATVKLSKAVREALGDDAEAIAVRERVSVLAGLARAEHSLNGIAPDDVAEELRWGVRRYLERRAGTAPLTLVFEDIHWAEPALLDLIEQVVESSRAPLFVLCLARPDLRDIRPNWGGGATNAAAIELAPLGPEDARRLIAELLQIDALPESVRSELVTRAEGNPLYLEEFLRMLIDTGQVERREGRWLGQPGISSLGVPPTLQGVIAARLDRVSPDVKQMLQRASLAGRLFSTAALTALAEGQAPPVQLLREAVRRDLLIEADERAVGTGRVFRFKHVLIRDVAYRSLTKRERSRLHDRYGRWLEQSLGERKGEIEDIIAFHAEQAYLLAREIRPQDDPALGQRAFALLRSAARNARHRGDENASGSLYERARGIARELSVPEDERIEVETFALFAAWQRGPTRELNDSLEHLLERARDAGPSEALVRLLRWSAFRDARWGPQSIARRMAFAAEAVRAARGSGDVDLVADARLIEASVGTTATEARRILLESLHDQRAAGAQRLLDATLAQLGRIAANLGAFSEGFAHREEALRIARESGSTMRIVFAITRLCDGLAHVGDLTRALALEEEALLIARELRLRREIGLCLTLRGQTLAELGDHRLAVDSLREALRETAALDLPPDHAFASIWIARSGLATGDIAQAEAAISSVSDETLREWDFLRSRALAVRGLIHAARGEPNQAERLLREALEIALPIEFGSHIAEIRRDLARFLISRGRGREAREHVEWLLNYYRDPAAKRRYNEAQELLRQCEAVAD